MDFGLEVRANRMILDLIGRIRVSPHPWWLSPLEKGRISLKNSPEKTIIVWLRFSRLIAASREGASMFWSRTRLVSFSEPTPLAIMGRA